VVHAREDSDRAGQVVAGLAGGLADTQHQVVDRRGVQLGHLGQRGPHHLHGQVVGAQVLERPLERAADRGAGGGHDHCFGHRHS